MERSFLQFYMGTNSLYEGYGDVKSFISEAKSKGLKSLVLADISTTAGYVKFYQECKNNDIKPIMGLTTPIDLPLANSFIFIEKNKDSIKKLYKSVGIDNINEEYFNDIEDSKIIKLYEKISKVRNFVVGKGKRKETEYKSFMEELYSFMKDEDVVLDKENPLLGSMLDNVTLINEMIRPEQGFLKIVSENEKGVIEINQLLTNAFKNGQTADKIKIEKSGEKFKRADYYYPLVDFKELSEKENIIISSITDFDDLIFRNENLKFRERIVNYISKNIRNFKLGVDEQKFEENEDNYRLAGIINSAFEYSKKFNINIYATNVARFINKNDYNIYDIKSSALTDQWYNSPKRVKKGSEGQFLHSYSEFKDKYKDYPNYFLDESEKISDDCNPEMIIGKNYLPASPIPEDYAISFIKKEFDKLNIEYEGNYSLLDFERVYTEYKLKNEDYSKLTNLERDLEIKKEFTNIASKPYLEEKAWNGVLNLLKKYKPNNWENLVDEYRERFDLELNIICDMGFAGYFLIVHDFIAESKKRGIPVGPGRGSGAGSIMAYGLDITIPDPIEFDLVFERFLNPERVSMPDFDIDFCTNGRAEVIDYVMDKYGRDAVAYIATEGKFKPKSAFKTLLRTYGFTVKQGDEISNVIPDDPFLKTKDLLEDEDFIEYLEERPAMKMVAENVKGIAKETSHMGVHAGGVVIAPTTLTDFSTVMMNPDGSGVATIYDKDDVESAGLVKFDFLGLSTLTVINNAVIQVKSNYDVDIEIDRINLNDENTYKLLQSAFTQEVFQLSSSGMKDLVKKLQVENIEDISALVALYRPGPMQSGMLDSYVNRKNGTEEIRYLHKKAEDITKNTYGTVIYQEQVMKIAQEVAGYTLGGADLLRRAMGKKKPAEMEKQKKIFLEGSLKENQKDRELELKKELNLKIDLDLRGFDFLSEYIDEYGHFSDKDKLDLFLKDFVEMNDNELEYLSFQTNNDKLEIGEIITEFKNKMYPKIKKKVEKHLGEGDSPSAKELSTSIYFSIFENVKYLNIFNVIEKFAGYGFNKSHSLAYAFVSYQTAYLKANYPKEFFAASLSNQGDLEKLSPIVYDMTHNFNIDLNKPCVNKSDYLYKANKNNNSVNFGLINIKSLGKYGELIEKERKENGSFRSVQDLIFRVAYRNMIEPKTANNKLSVGAFKGLLYSGSLDIFIINNNDLKLSKVELMQKRELLLKEYEIISKNYPDNIESSVKERLSNEFYPSSILENIEGFTMEQNLLVKKIAYAKKFSDILPIDYNWENDNSLEDIKFFEDNDYLSFLSKINKDIEGIDEFFKLSKKTSNFYKKERDIEKYKELEKDFIDKICQNKEISDKFQNIGENIFGSGFNKNGYSKIIEIYHQVEKIKKSKKKDLTPLRILDVKSMYDYKEEDLYKKAKNTIQVIKKRKVDLIKDINSELKSSMGFENSEWLNLEKEYTGGFITMHPVNLNNAIEKTKQNYNPVIDVSYLDKISNDHELLENKKGQIVYIAASFTELKPMKTKNGGDMAIITLSDETGDYEAIMFDGLFNEMGDYLKAGIVGTIGVKIGEYNGKPSMEVKEVKLHSPDVLVEFGKENVKPQYNMANRK